MSLMSLYAYDKIKYKLYGTLYQTNSVPLIPLKNKLKMCKRPITTILLSLQKCLAINDQLGQNKTAKVKKPEGSKGIHLAGKQTNDY